jgi:hypothetical protein
MAGLQAAEAVSGRPVFIHGNWFAGRGNGHEEK